jgi:hypothetical protein
VKQLIHRIRTADRRRLAVTGVVLVTFGVLNWGLAHLVGLLIDHNPHGYGTSDAASSGYFMGFLAALAVVDLMRRLHDALIGRFAKQTLAATE